MIRTCSRQILPKNNGKVLKYFNISFDNNENKFLSIASRCRNDVVILVKFHVNRESLFSSKEHALANRVFTVM